MSTELPIGPSSPMQQLAVDAFEKVQILVLGGAMYGGKVQPYSSKVLTVHGFKPLKEVKVGDFILNPNGASQKILAVHPHKNHTFYKVNFSDGTSTYCGDEHLWVAWRGEKQTNVQKKLNKFYGKNDQESLYDNNAEVISLENIRKWMDSGYFVHTPLNKKVDFVQKPVDIDPYLLGYLIGDGCITGSRNISITRHEDDTHIDDYVEGLGFQSRTIKSNNMPLSFYGDSEIFLKESLTKLKLYGTHSKTKFIPENYLKNSSNIRWALFQGLMDSDGYVDYRGHLEYSTISPKLSEDFIFLVRSLGGKVSVKKCRGSYKDTEGVKVECNDYYRHYLRFSCSEAPFKLERKVSRYKPATRLSRVITSIEEGFVGDGCCITVSDPNRLYITDDFIVTHNSYLAATLSTLYAANPDSRIGVFRRTLGEMKQGGGIIDTFKAVYRPLESYCKLDIAGNPPVGKILTGPGAGDKRGDGCRIDFRQMDNEKDQEKVRGGAYSLAVIEEATPYFTQEEIEMVSSRLRPFGEGGMPSKMIITCNPLKDHFICKLIQDYYLDEEGYAIREHCGDVRWYYKYDNEYYWGDSAQEVVDIVDPMGAFSFVELTEKEKLERITSFSFVQLTAKDNPIGMARDPKYMARLEGMDKVKKARNLYGNWFVEEEGGSVFQRKMIRGEKGERVKRLEDLPKGCVARRGVDKAYEECSDKNPDPDYTSISPLFLKDRDGLYWIMGNQHPDTTDKKPFKKSDKPVLGRFRKLPGERDNIITKQLKMDQANADLYGYSEPVVAIPKDSGGGSGDYHATVAKLTEEGIKVVKDKSIPNLPGKKMADFLGFTSACEQRLVYIIEETFDPDTLECWYKELEGFDGTPSTRLKKDDQVDSTALGFNTVRESKRPYKTPHTGYTIVNTKAATLKDTLSQ